MYQFKHNSWGTERAEQIFHFLDVEGVGEGNTFWRVIRNLPIIVGGVGVLGSVVLLLHGLCLLFGGGCFSGVRADFDFVGGADRLSKKVQLNSPSTTTSRLLGDWKILLGQNQRERHGRFLSLGNDVGLNIHVLRGGVQVCCKQRL